MEDITKDYFMRGAQTVLDCLASYQADEMLGECDNCHHNLMCDKPCWMMWRDDFIKIVEEYMPIEDRESLWDRDLIDGEKS